MIQTAVTRPTSIYADPAHLELAASLYRNITTSPIKTAVYQFMPRFGIWSYNSAIQIDAADSTQEALIPNRIRDPILREIKILSQSARLKSAPHVYTALTYSYSSFGGAFSFLRPILLVPYHHLFRFGQASENRSDGLWTFTDDETRFWIARQIVQIKENHGLYRIALKVILFSILYFLYSHPLTRFAGMSLGALAIAGYLLLERKRENQSDLKAVRLLANRTGDWERAKRAAVFALKKVERQNIHRWNHNLICRIYINRSGQNFADLTHSLLKTRIQNIQFEVEK